MRKHWLDTVRWSTVLLVLLFHVFYYYNSHFDGSGIGGFGGEQPQDAVCYILYPWMMYLMFLVAGISSRYALEREVGLPEQLSAHRRFFRNRTVKLLVPGTIGLFVWHWITGYFNLMTVGHSHHVENMLALLPKGAVYPMLAVSGGGHLWFIQLLWLFSILLILIRLIERDRLYQVVQRLLTQMRMPAHCLMLFLWMLLLWLGAQTVLPSGSLNGLESLVNTYRPVSYAVPFLLGYYAFTNEQLLDTIRKLRWPLLLSAIAGAILIVVFTFGEDSASPEYLRSWYNNFYAWLAMLAAIAITLQWGNRESRIGAYLSRVSYGWYILHYIVIAGLGYTLFMYTTLPPWADYSILFIAVFTATPILYEIIRRIPFLRWCVLGISKKKQKNTSNH